MKIRLAEINDVELLFKYDKHISKAEMINSAELKRIYLAEENGCLVGWLRYNLFWDNTPFMNMLYVFEKYRGKGFGRRLVSFWESDMLRQGFNTFMTSTQADEYAQHFYFKLGYEAIGGFRPDNDIYEIIFAKIFKALAGGI